VSDAVERLRGALADRYSIERELGRGGMATVYLARDVRHDRPVALKLLHAELAATLGPERFQREIRMAARLQHPHILTVHDSGDAGGQLWFTMPFVEGESLRDRLRRERQLPINDAVRIAREAASALDYAHRHDIIHRDVKPENLLLTADGQVLVADFGIARALGAASEAGLTETGTSIGTPAYMSPEQASGERALDGRTDIYSLGAVLYEMLAGEPPFTGPTAQAVIAKRFTGEIPALRKARPSVPEDVDRAITRALAVVPADRFGTAAEFAKALDTDRWTDGPMAGASSRETALNAQPPISPSADGLAHSPGRRPARGLLLLGLGFLLGLGVLFAWRRSHVGGDANPDTVKTIAVLPFDNLGASDDEYFSDGMTDEVRGKLANLAGLRVTARSSSREYKKTTKRPQEIGRELGVDYLLTGTVRWEKDASGKRARVSPELIQVATGATTWQQPFDAKLTDVFQVQADIASRVADALNVALGSSQKESLAERPTASLAAYDAYLKGEAASQGVNTPDPIRLGQGAVFYEQAVALDSTFLEAWVQLARAHAARYYSGTPDPAGAAKARRAAERAVALAPERAEGRLAMGDYHSFVTADPARALAEYEAGLKVAPGRAELLVGAAFAEQSLGRWDAALKHLDQAQALDPRSVLTARRRATTLLWLRRDPEALVAADRALALQPTNINLGLVKTMAVLARGDLEGARAWMRSAPSEIEPTALVAFFGIYWDLYWVLDDQQQRLLLRLSPSAFGDDRGNWAIVRTQTSYLRGDLAAARVYADSARLAFEEQIRAAPDDAQRHMFLGLALAYLGRKGEAMREGEKGLALQPIAKDGYSGPYNQHLLARIYMLVGEHDKALDQLEPLLKIPYFLSPGWLKIDPTFDPLRKYPRFQRLVERGPAS
jgi:TolB-like protein/Flp pilus assembly protein TadD